MSLTLLLRTPPSPVDGGVLDLKWDTYIQVMGPELNPNPDFTTTIDDWTAIGWDGVGYDETSVDTFEWVTGADPYLHYLHTAIDSSAHNYGAVLGDFAGDFYYPYTAEKVDAAGSDKFIVEIDIEVLQRGAISPWLHIPFLAEGIGKRAELRIQIPAGTQRQKVRFIGGPQDDMANGGIYAHEVTRMSLMVGNDAGSWGENLTIGETLEFRLYSVRIAQLDGEPQDLKWDMIAQVNGPSQELIWNTVAEVNGQVEELIWNTFAPVDGNPQELLWNMGSAVNAASATLKWDTIAQVNGNPQELIWDLRSEVAGGVLDLLWDTRAEVNGNAQELIWNLAAAVNGNPQELIWNLAAEVSGNVIELLWNMGAAVNAAPQTLKWDLAAAVDGPVEELIWNLSSAVDGNPQELVWDLRNSVDGPVLDFIWDLRAEVAGQVLELIWALEAEAPDPSPQHSGILSGLVAIALLDGIVRRLDLRDGAPIVRATGGEPGTLTGAMVAIDHNEGAPFRTTTGGVPHG
jgi:hypothetical protein